MKTLVLGDIHGRDWWYDIIKNETPDKVIFLGDYVSTHDNLTPENQIRNLERILDFKEENELMTILLRGNHDIQHIAREYHVSGYSQQVANWFQNNEHYNRFVDDTQWIYVDTDNKRVYSHAGITENWITHNNRLFTTFDSINECNTYPVFQFNQHCWNPYGDDPEQSCIWVRPMSLSKNAIKGYTQFVGHTTVEHIYDMKEEYAHCKEHIWLCDTRLKEYIIIEDDDIFVKKYEKGEI